MVSSYSGGGKCITQNRSNMVSLSSHLYTRGDNGAVSTIYWTGVHPLLLLLLLLLLLGSDPKAETRLYVTVNGFEFHVYNRTSLYAQLQEIFGLEPTLITPTKDEEKSQAEDRGTTLDRWVGVFWSNKVSLTGAWKCNYQ